MIDAGHEGTERIMADLLCQLLTQELSNKDLEAEIFALKTQEVLKTC